VGTTLPDLASLIELCRQVATRELVRLIKGLLESPTSDVAVVSGIVIHGPRGDRVAILEAWVTIGSGDAVSLV
jgi:hypothetical protein